MRSVVALALRSGIPVTAWLAEDDQTLLTAFELYAEEDEKVERAGRRGGGRGPVMSG